MQFPARTLMSAALLVGTGVATAGEYADRAVHPSMFPIQVCVSGDAAAHGYTPAEAVAEVQAAVDVWQRAVPCSVIEFGEAKWGCGGSLTSVFGIGQFDVVLGRTQGPLFIYDGDLYEQDFFEKHPFEAGGVRFDDSYRAATMWINPDYSSPCSPQLQPMVAEVLGEFLGRISSDGPGLVGPEGYCSPFTPSAEETKAVAKVYEVVPELTCSPGPDDVDVEPCDGEACHAVTCWAESTYDEVQSYSWSFERAQMSESDRPWAWHRYRSEGTHTVEVCVDGVLDGHECSACVEQVAVVVGNDPADNVGVDGDVRKRQGCSCRNQGRSGRLFAELTSMMLARRR